MWAPSISTASRPDALRAGGFKPMASNSMEARQTNCGVAILEAASAGLRSILLPNRHFRSPANTAIDGCAPRRQTRLRDEVVAIW
jgi:hypothetical protein